MLGYVMTQVALRLTVMTIVFITGVGWIVAGVLTGEPAAIGLGAVGALSALIFNIASIHVAGRALKVWEEKGLLEDVLKDFRQAKILHRNDVRAGETYLFGQDVILLYTDIVSMHVANRISKHIDRMDTTYHVLVAVLPDGSEHLVLTMNDTRKAILLTDAVMEQVKEHNPGVRLQPFSDGYREAFNCKR